jgi:hypothetical protein
MKRRCFTQAGFALLPCALLLTMVLLALSASLQSARQQLTITLAHADLHRTRLLAESSLAEGEHDLRSRFEAMSSAEDARSPEQQFALSCARTTSELSGYQLDLVHSDDLTALCRITASRTGRAQGTQISLQAEFELKACPQSDESAASKELEPLTGLMVLGEDVLASCKGKVRLLSWRMLSEV